MKKKIIVGISGSSGAIYAKMLLDQLSVIPEQWESVGVVVSDNARVNWELEIGPTDWSVYPFQFYSGKDFFAPFASGSARYDTMIVCPCSMGMLARIATGISNDLMTRAADVVLKERRRLILVTRETPLSLIHLNNMKAVTEAGGIICPAVPSFYSRPDSMEALIATVTHRVLDLAGLEAPGFRWGEEHTSHV